jgi:nicotinate-nucleotide adenylyltransferase
VIPRKRRPARAKRRATPPGKTGGGPRPGRGCVKSRRGRRIGLFGGSFNPAHAGHRHVSLLALKRLALDEVWWLVSPQNPLKPEAGMAPYRSRLEQATATARHPRLRVTDIERRLGTHYTVETLTRLKRLYPHHRFVWIMGADNLPDFSRWRRWPEVFASVPVAIFDRWPYARFVGVSKPCLRFVRYRVPERGARRLARRVPPAWTFVHSRLHPARGTEIRAAGAAVGSQRGDDHNHA